MELKGWTRKAWVRWAIVIGAIGASATLTVVALVLGRAPVSNRAPATSHPATSLRRRVPRAPQVQLSPGASQLTATWTSPDDHGSPITGYLVIVRHQGTIPYQKLADADTHSITIGGLDNGIRYEVVVRAMSAVGVGLAGHSTAEPASVPAAVATVSVMPKPSMLVVQWSPASNNGAPIETYQVVATPSSGGASFSVQTGINTSTRLTGLQDGTTYAITVSAVNALGTGPTSAPTLGTPATRPSAPGELTLQGSSGAVTAAWTAPAETGGSPVVSYRVVLLGRTIPTRIATVAAPAMSTIFTSVPGGATYQVALQAQNGVGLGPPTRASISLSS